MRICYGHLCYLTTGGALFGREYAAVSNDTAGYAAPQGLRNILIMQGNHQSWDISLGLEAAIVILQRRNMLQCLYGRHC